MQLSRGISIGAGAGITLYSVLVMWFVATSPDLQIRCLLVDGTESTGTAPTTDEIPARSVSSETGADNRTAGKVTGIRIQRSPESNSTLVPDASDLLTSINRRPTRTFLDFVHRLRELRGAHISPGGQMSAGGDPREYPRNQMPGVVWIGNHERRVEIDFLRAETGEAEWNYITVDSLPLREILLTLFWFVLQLVILIVGGLASHSRPRDTSARMFYAMCVTAMGAFIGGFHWWILAATPWLNYPFLICAGLLPPVTLHFFLVFPRPGGVMASHPRVVMMFLYIPATIFIASILTLYTAAFVINSDAVTDANLPRVLSLLHWMRPVIYTYIAIAGVYFSLTVITLLRALNTNRNPIEREQIKWILWAALFASIPVGYTLSLALQDQVGLVLGRARIPMFLASLSFMLAYAVGMVRHRLMLVDQILSKGALYYLASTLVTAGFAATVALGSVTPWLLNLSLTPVQHVIVVVILIVAVVLMLWLRDQFQRIVDQQFFREKYRLDKALQRMNRAAEHMVQPGALGDVLLGTFRDVMHVERAALYTRPASSVGPFRMTGVAHGDDMPVELTEAMIPLADSGAVQRIPSANRESMSPLQRFLHDLRIELIYPLTTEDGLVGLVLLGPKRGRHGFSAEDLTFLQAMAHITTVALHTVRANLDMVRLNDELQLKVDRISQQQRQIAMLRSELSTLQPPPRARVESAGAFERDVIIGNSPAVQQVLQTIQKVAPSDSTVMIRGESGTGKELLAQVIHDNSPRKDGPVIKVHCASLAPSLLESELFGHAKGAFTGANTDKIGRFQAAHRGTIFLDEIGDISIETQIKLLRVLQERCFEPVGSTRTVPVDVRLITATHQDLEQLIRIGRFREDLYYRLNVIRVTLPPLRDRPEDLLELVFHFLVRAANRVGKPVTRIDDAAMQALERYSWPGNVRELENVIERAVVLTEATVIGVRDLPLELVAGGSRLPPVRQRDIEVKPSGQLTANRTAREFSPSTGVAATSKAAKIEQERGMLVQALAECAGNKAEAARLLGIPRSTFYSRLKKLKIS